MEEKYEFGSKEHIAKWRKEEEDKRNNASASPLDKEAIGVGKSLVFDDKTGDLILTPDPAVKEKNLVVDALYRDGFF